MRGSMRGSMGEVGVGRRSEEPSPQEGRQLHLHPGGFDQRPDELRHLSVCGDHARWNSQKMRERLLHGEPLLERCLQSHALESEQGAVVTQTQGYGRRRGMGGSR